MPSIVASMSRQEISTTTFSLRSVAFWPVAFGAVMLMGIALLAPKLGQLRRDQDVYVANQVRLVQLEAQVQHIRELIVALENDPRFRAQVAHTVFGQAATSASAQSLRLPAELAYDIKRTPEMRLDHHAWVATTQPQWLIDKIAPWERNPRVRWMSLLGAGLVLVFAFLCLKPTGYNAVSGSPGLWQQLMARYRR